MTWHLYKSEDSNTHPKIDCPMVVYGGAPFYRNLLDIFKWDNNTKNFIYYDKRVLSVDECYYAYIGYVPSGYKTHEALKCVDDSDCKIGCHDNGYCMYYEFECEQQRKVNEYSLEEKRIWKEFE